MMVEIQLEHSIKDESPPKYSDRDPPWVTGFGSKVQLISFWNQTFLRFWTITGGNILYCWAIKRVGGGESRDSLYNIKTDLGLKQQLP